MELRSHCPTSATNQGEIMNFISERGDHRVNDAPPLSNMTEVHVAWLSAGANGDVASMRQLLNQFPEWLDLQRQLVGGATSDWTSSPRPYSSTEFHLDTIGASALHTSAWNGKLEIIEFLLEMGQNPDTPGNGDATPIMVAIMRLTLMTMRCMIRDGEAIKRNILSDCRQEDEKQRMQVIAVIELLLKFGADVNSRMQEGKTALHLSTSDDAYDIALVLLDAGASIDTKDENGKTPLHYCVYEKGLLVTNLLLSRGANIDVEDVDGLTVLDLVVRRADLNLLQLFLNHHQWVVTPERQDFAGVVLLQAVEVEVEDVVRYIVDNDYALVNVRNSMGENPMHRAILRRSPALMEVLLDLDGDGDIMTAATELLETPAHYAARYGSNREMVTLLQCLTSKLGNLQELAALGAENPLNVVDVRGMTSLYVASTIDQQSGGSTVNDLEVRDAKVRLLLDHGAMLFAPNVLAQKFAGLNARNSHHLALPVQIQRCLLMWLVETRARDGIEDEGQDAELAVEVLSEFCIRWIAYIANGGSSLTLVSIVTSAGYGHELLPMLVGLPLRGRGLSKWLRQLEKYARKGRCHTLLLKLYDEMLYAWSGQYTTEGPDE